MTSSCDSNQRPGLRARLRGRSAWLGFAILGAVLVFAIFLSGYAAVAFVAPTTARWHRVTMASDVSPRNGVLADQIRAEGARRHLDIVQTTKEYGTLEALEEIDSRRAIDLALVIGGVTSRKYPRVRTVTTLSKEYLQFLVKPEFAEKGITGLHGKRIYIGPSSTASHFVARDVLEFVGLHAVDSDNESGYRIDATPRDQVLRELARIESLTEPERTEAIARLPDAVLILAPLPSVHVQALITRFAYQLLPLPFADAYALDYLNPPTEEGVRIERAMLTPSVIPAYTYGRTPAEPANECPTICFPLILVARDEVDREAVSTLLQIIYDSSLKSMIRPPPLDDQVNPFPRHGGTEHYIHRNDSVLTPEIASRLGTAVGGMGAFVSGLIAFYGFLRLRKLSRFESYYREIGQIEMIAYGLEQDPDAPSDLESLRTNLESRLTALKCRVLDDFAEGGLRGEALMAGIIALINDTRESLAGMVTSRDGARERFAAGKAEQTSSSARPVERIAGPHDKLKDQQLRARAGEVRGR